MFLGLTINAQHVLEIKKLQVFSSASMDLNDLFNKTIIHLLPGVIVFCFVENPISHFCCVGMYSAFLFLSCAFVITAPALI